MQKMNLGENMLFRKLKKLKFHCFTEAGAVLGWAVLAQNLEYVYIAFRIGHSHPFSSTWVGPKQALPPPPQSGSRY